MLSLLSCAPLMVCLLGQAPTTPTVDEIAAAVKRLGAARFQERQDASDFLWQAGDAAIPALRSAAQSDDAEVRLRATLILDDLRFGLYADTPPEVAALVQRFRRGDGDVRRVVLRELLKQGHTKNMAALMRASGDAFLQGEFLQEIEKIVPQLLIEERFEEAEELLALAGDPDRQLDQGQRRYAAYLLLRGRLDARIAELRAAGPPNNRQARLLAHLLRAKGDHSAALPLARQAGAKSLVEDLLHRLGDWRQLATDAHIPGDDGVERLGFVVAFHRLAGNHEQAAAAMLALEQLAEQNPAEAWMCGEALMVNGAWERAQALFEKHSPSRAFELHLAQLRFPEAFAAAGIDDPRHAAEWFSLRAPALVKGSAESNAHFRLGLKAATALYRVGEPDEGARLFEEVALMARSVSALPLGAVIEAELLVGRRDAARQRVVEWLRLPNVDRKALVSSWFPQQPQLAGSWWDWLREHDAEIPEAETFAQLERLLPLDAAHMLPAAELEALTSKAERVVRALRPAERLRPLEMLGDTCLLHGRRDLARRFLEQRAQTEFPTQDDPFGADASPRYDALLRVSDLLAEDGAWEDAAVWRHRAWEEDRRRPLALYLEGEARIRLGQHEEGRAQKARASLLCLDDVERRAALAEGLERRKLTDEARDQWRLVLHLGPWDAWEGSEAWAVSRAARQLGNDRSQTAPQEAADSWRRWFLYLLKTNSAFLEMAHYPQIAHLIHKTRARGFAESGDWAMAAAEARLAQDALPGDIDFPLELIPQLDEAGRMSEANELFRRPFQAHQRLLEQFSNSATHHNNLAWFAARCDRELDAALRHARRAVKLYPEKASFLDTLAEVHYRRGDHDEAIRLARRCLEKEPTNEHFQQQLARFEMAR